MPTELPFEKPFFLDSLERSFRFKETHFRETTFFQLEYIVEKKISHRRKAEEPCTHENMAVFTRILHPVHIKLKYQ